MEYKTLRKKYQVKYKNKEELTMESSLELFYAINKIYQGNIFGVKIRTLIPHSKSIENELNFSIELEGNRNNLITKVKSILEEELNKILMEVKE